MHPRVSAKTTVISHQSSAQCTPKLENVQIWLFCQNSICFQILALVLEKLLVHWITCHLACLEQHLAYMYEGVNYIAKSAMTRCVVFVVIVKMHVSKWNCPLTPPKFTISIVFLVIKTNSGTFCNIVYILIHAELQDVLIWWSRGIGSFGWLNRSS